MGGAVACSRGRGKPCPYRSLMPKDRVFLLVTGAVALAGLVCLLGVAVYLGLPASWPSAPPALVTPTQALSLAALPESALPPTSLIPTLPPEWTAVPFPTRAAPTTSQPAPAPLNASAPASPIPSATLSVVDAGLTSVPASPLPSATPAAVDAGLPTGAPTASPASGVSPTAITLQPTSTPQPSATNAPDGQRAEAGGLALTVIGVSKQGDAWPVHLVVDVVLENVSREQVHYGYTYFSVVDSTGLSYDATADAPQPGLQEGDLARGSQVRGKVAFEIYPEADGLWLIYGDSELIQVNLGQ